jgi:hypothetical protein
MKGIYMIKNAVSTILLFFLALGFAFTSGASEIPTVVVATDHVPTSIEQVGDQLLVDTTGADVNWSCLGAVAAYTAAALALGAATGGVGLAVSGAYAPLAAVFCV